ncbi:phage tail assembly chaperone [Tsuneonella sp. CC-YZS046]|uniref:phage tail assembly chaperone n=1 Tax=Tsuneonella sp. CC-YZS046 TaxID=3042152 RepID=UPI002D777CC2|nr:phage tail assembly chaperone [Tsuneonella sp. CC-YZS046]WRO65812.1 phage tail assembly chaperone [Tsuneonella sp. CC-YZS046]
MNRAFGPAALRLCAFAAQLLGWRPAHFWNATPAELAAALVPCAADGATPLSRAELQTLLEQENDG